MDKHDGRNYGPIDYTAGVHLNAERDDFGHTLYWMTIDGEDKGLSASQYETLMNMFYDERKHERERIVKLLEPYAKSCENGKCDCLSADSTIALINGVE